MIILHLVDDNPLFFLYNPLSCWWYSFICFMIILFDDLSLIFFMIVLYLYYDNPLSFFVIIFYLFDDNPFFTSSLQIFVSNIWLKYFEINFVLRQRVFKYLFLIFSWNILKYILYRDKQFANICFCPNGNSPNIEITASKCSDVR